MRAQLRVGDLPLRTTAAGKICAFTLQLTRSRDDSRHQRQSDEHRACTKYILLSLKFVLSQQSSCVWRSRSTLSSFSGGLQDSLLTTSVDERLIS